MPELPYHPNAMSFHYARRISDHEIELSLGFVGKDQMVATVHAHTPIGEVLKYARKALADHKQGIRHVAFVVKQGAKT